MLVTDDKNHTSEIVIWHQGDHPPSSRELDGWNPGLETKKEFIAERFCDSHHETEFSLKIAKLVVAAINDLPGLLVENRRLREALASRQENQAITPFGRMVAS